MAEHQTMNTIIHAAFRRDLARLDAALAGFPTGSRQRAGQLNAAWDNLASQLHQHHQDEETIFWPALRTLGADDSMIGDLGGEHARMLAALDEAGRLMAAFRADPSADNAQAARSAIAELTGVVDGHLDHEERDLEPFVVRQLATPEMKAAQVAVRKAHKGGAGTFFAWLMDTDDPEVKAALRREIPPPVLFVIGRIGGRSYRRTVARAWVTAA
ncbi:MAG: hemerythrin domain-containing protein [Actinomycetota bacterium]|nr:hemerythrin domain-containing protein [Actinomycetota bacterium]